MTNPNNNPAARTATWNTRAMVRDLLNDAEAALHTCLHEGTVATEAAFIDARDAALDELTAGFIFPTTVAEAKVSDRAYADLDAISGMSWTESLAAARALVVHIPAD